MVNLGLKGREGVTVYYIPPYDGKTKVTAFPKVNCSFSKESRMARASLIQWIGFPHDRW